MGINRRPFHPTFFRLDPVVHKRLRIVAFERGISMSEALTVAVDLWLRKYSPRSSAREIKAIVENPHA